MQLEKYTEGNSFLNIAQRFLGSNIVPDFRHNEHAKESPPKPSMKRWFHFGGGQLHFVTENQ